MKDPKRQAAGRKSRRKGAGFELKIAKEFEAWWGKGHFRRCPSSGGWSTPAARDGFNTNGDIITTNRDFPWCIENKNCEGWTLDQLLLNDGCIIHTWWEQTVDETPDDLKPMLIFKKNHQKPMVMVFADVQESFGAMLVDKLPQGFRKFFTLDRNKRAVVIFALEDLFKIRPEMVGRTDENE